MSYVAIWLQACLHWRCAYFQTLSWNDTIFVVDWDILYKLCGSANKWSKGFVFSGKIRWQFFSCNKACSKYHTRTVRPRPNIRSHSVLFFLFCVPQSVKTKETNPTRPGSPTPCKQALRLKFTKKPWNMFISCRHFQFSFDFFHPSL